MNWKQTIPLLAALFLALLPVRSRAGDNGYWVLTGTKLLENKKTLRDIGGISGARIWTVRKNLATHSSGATIAWGDPPEKIPVGKETEVTIPCMRTYPGNISSAEAARKGILIVAQATMVYDSCTIDFSLDGDCLAWAGKTRKIYSEDTRHLVLNISASTAALAHPESTGQTYTYTRAGDGYTDEDTILTPPDEGEFTVGDIPWEWIIPAGLVAGGLVLGKKIKKPKPPKGGQAPSGKKKPKDKEKEEEEEKKEISYRMYVYKDFGDAIQAGAGPVRVCARIARVEDGVERDDAGMTAAIVPSTTGLTLHSSGMHGRYMAANVSAPVGTSGEGTVTFTLRTPFGGFVRNIVFRLTGNPEIKFPALSEDGKNWLMDAGLDTVDMIAGGRGRDRLRFVFQDAATEPTGIRFLDTDGFDISYEKDAGKPFTYYACIQNKTEPIPKESKIFAEPVARTITIEATFSGKLKVYGRFTINLYPMGIAVFPVESRKLSGREIVQNGRLDVVSYRVNDSWNTGLEKEIRASAFHLHFGAERADGTAVPVEEVRFSFAKKLKAEETRSEGVASHYSYTVGSGNEDKSHVFFLPETVSPELVGTHEMLLEVRASGGGKQETEMIPLRILGLDPGPPVEWYREHQLLLEAITRYYPADMAPTKRREVEENFNSPEVCDVAELRTLRRTVILWAQTYWRQQNDIARQQDDLYWARVWTLTVWGTKKLKWAGDVAFTVLISFKLGPNYEAWLSPVKDFAADAIGNLIADVNYGRGEYKYLKNFESKAYEALEKLALAQIKGEEMTKAYSSDTRKVFLKAGLVMTSFLLLDFFKNYREMEEGERDYWKAFTRAFSNLSLEALKKIFGAYLDKLMNSPKMEQFFRSKFMQMINSKVKGATRTNYTYNGRPLVVRYQGKLISIQGTATGNVDVARGAARGLNLHLADGRIVRIPNVRADQGNAYLGYIEVISEVLGKTFEDAVKLVLDTGVKNAEKAAQDGTALIYLGIDLSFLDPDLPPLTVEIDKKQFCNNPLSEGFGLIFKTIFGCLKLGDLVLKLLPSPMEALQNAYDTTEKVWQYLAGKTDGEQIDWSIFDDD